MAQLQTILDHVHQTLKPRIGEGKVADYIPALARVRASQLGLAAISVDGETAQAGDAAQPFSIQSISKVFTLTLALDRLGDALWHRVGREPSGSAFNSIVQLEAEQGLPRNPLINAGAIAVSDAILADRSPDQAKSAVLEMVRSLSDDVTIEMDPEVAQSEAQSGFRNASLAHFMKAFKNLDNDVACVLDVYFHQCAIAMNCIQLARAGLFLASNGTDPISGRSIVRPERARRINAIMLTCGHYDASGDFAFRVGLPGKSGVGGGILCIAPGKAAIAVWSPGLNANGNSLLGTEALEAIAQRTGWSVFG